MLVTCPLCAESFENPSPGNHTCGHCRSPLIIAPDGTTTAVERSSKSRGPKSIPDWAQAGRQPTPWEKRGELGFFTGLYRTVYRSCFKPEGFWSTVEPQTAFGQAFLYAWLLSLVSAILQVPVNRFILPSSIRQITAGPPLADRLPEPFTQWADWIVANPLTTAAGISAFTVVIFPLAFMFSAALTHLGCLLFGCAQNGFRATARVVGYAMAPSLLAWVPQVGFLLVIYIVILEVWGLMHLQETTFGRAVAAVLVIPIAFACCVAPLIIVFGVAIAIPAL